MANQAVSNIISKDGGRYAIKSATGITVSNTYDQQALKDDFTKLVRDISPLETPIYSMATAKKALQSIVNYQVHSLKDADDNARVEGEAVISPSNQNVVEVLQNFCQIFTKGYQVTGSMEAAALYGDEQSELARRSIWASREIKRDIEFAALRDETKVGDAGAGSPGVRRMASLMGQIDKPDVEASKGSALDSQLYDEANLLALWQMIYEKGGNPDSLVISPGEAIITSGFATTSGKTRDFIDGQTTVTNKVSVYISDFGVAKVFIDRFIADKRVMLIESEYLCAKELRAPHRKKLAETGDAKNEAIIAEVCLINEAPASMGYLTTAAPV